MKPLLIRDLILYVEIFPPEAESQSRRGEPIDSVTRRPIALEIHYTAKSEQTRQDRSELAKHGEQWRDDEWEPVVYSYLTQKPSYKDRKLETCSRSVWGSDVFQPKFGKTPQKSPRFLSRKCDLTQTSSSKWINASRFPLDQTMARKVKCAIRHTAKTQTNHVFLLASY